MPHNALRQAIQLLKPKILPHLCDDVLLLIFDHCSFKVNLVCRRWYIISHKRRGPIRITNDWRCQILLTLYPNISVIYKPKKDGKNKLLIIPENITSNVVIDGTTGELPNIRGDLDHLIVNLISICFSQNEHRIEFISQLIDYTVRWMSGRIRRLSISINGSLINMTSMNDVYQAGISFTSPDYGLRGSRGIQNGGGPRGRWDYYEELEPNRRFNIKTNKWESNKPNKRQLKKSKAYQHYQSSSK